jgi:hypothetical protein
MAKMQNEIESDSYTTASNNEDEKLNFKCDFDKCFDDVVASMGKGSAGKKKSAKLRKSDSNNTLVKSLDSEIDLYLSMEELNKDFSPLQWWKKI